MEKVSVLWALLYGFFAFFLGCMSLFVTCAIFIDIIEKPTTSVEAILSPALGAVTLILFTAGCKFVNLAINKSFRIN
jgi:hypothetical protein